MLSTSGTCLSIDCFPSSGLDYEDRQARNDLRRSTLFLFHYIGFHGEMDYHQGKE